MRHLSNSLTSFGSTHENFSLQTFSPLFSRGGSWHIWQKLWTFSHYRQHDMCDIRHSLKMTTRARGKTGKGRRRRTKMKISHQKLNEKTTPNTENNKIYISGVWFDQKVWRERTELSFWLSFPFFSRLCGCFFLHPSRRSQSTLRAQQIDECKTHWTSTRAAAAAVRMSEWV